MKYLDLQGLNALVAQIKAADAVNASAISTETTNRTNADDALSTRIDTLETWQSTMTSENVDDVINTFKEVENFLAGYKESDSLASVIEAAKIAGSEAVGSLDLPAVGAGDTTQVITQVAQSNGKVSAVATDFSSFLGTTASTAYSGSAGAQVAANVEAIEASIGKQSITVVESTENAVTAGSVTMVIATSKEAQQSVVINSVSKAEIDALFA